jgi:NodT family efflux transporter outer membrane factor (OMF) lipoprotein
VPRTPLILFVLSLLLHGCATHIGARDNNLSIPQQWRHSASSAEGTANTAAPTVDLQQWWKPFHESALDQLVAEVVRANLSVREGLARLVAARAMERADTAAYRPQAQVAGAPENTPDARETFYQLGVEADWPLGLFGREAATRQAASADTALALSNAQSVYADVVAETVRTYIEWRTARAAATNIDAQIEAQTKRMQLMRARLRLRLSSAREVEAEEGHLTELQSRHLALERTMAETSERLGLLLARSDVANPEDPDPAGVPALTPFRIEQLPANLVRTRADIRRAEESVLKAGAELNLARADLYPQLTLGGSLMIALPLTGAAGATHVLASVAPTIEIPLFDWGRRRARVDAQSAELDAALIAYKESVLTAVHEVETALGNLETLRQDAQLRRAQAEQANHGEARVRASVRLHLASDLDVLAARVSSLEANAVLLEAEGAHALAYVALFQTLGGASLPALAS